MELQVVRHATATEFFKDFYSVEHSAALSYQLQRMFESGAAKEGDYFLLRDEGKPYLNIEIYRNNTRRIWEKPPVICPKAVPDRAKSLESLRLVYEFLKNDEYYFSHNDRLEIIVGSDNFLSDIMAELNPEYGYENIGSYTIFKLKTGSFPELRLPAGINMKPFTDIEPERRFVMVTENDALACWRNKVIPESIYQDYLDDGYFSEELWQILYENGEFAGFIMPVFTSGLKKRISLLNYHLTEKNNSDTAKAAVYEVCRMAEINAVTQLEFTVKNSDTALIDFLSSSSAAKAGSFIRNIIK